jgi:hypothetical protein
LFGFRPGEPQLSDTESKGLIPYKSEQDEDCYYDHNQGQAFNYDLEPRSITAKEMEYVKSKTFIGTNPMIYE